MRLNKIRNRRMIIFTAVFFMISCRAQEAVSLPLYAAAAADTDFDADTDLDTDTDSDTDEDKPVNPPIPPGEQNDPPAAFPIPGLSGQYVHDLIQVARSQIGYREDPATHRTIYSDWSEELGIGNISRGRPWCSEFVSWCADRAGIPWEIVMPRASVGKQRKFYSDAGRYYVVDNGHDHTACGCGAASGGKTISLSEIRPGDILLIETNGNYMTGPDHTALSLGVYGSRVNTIEGNVNKKTDPKTGKSYGEVGLKSRAASQIHGVCRPAYNGRCGANGHTWDEGVCDRKADCENPGRTIYTCTTCSEIKIEEIPKLAHKPVKLKGVPAECETPGWTDGTYCTVCGQIVKARNVIPAKQHKWKTEHVRKGATAVKDGLQSMYCTVCGAGKLEVIPAKGAPKKGTALTDAKKNAVYTVTKAGAKGGTVAYTRPVSRKKTSVSIPSAVTIDGIRYQVTSVGRRAFYKYSRLKSVTLPSSVTKIGSQSFYKCKNLTDITIRTKKLVKKNVGSKAFKGIHSRAVVHVPSGKISSYKKLLRARGAGKSVSFRR